MSRTQHVNVGLIGCGQIAQSVHLRILQSLPGVRVIALADADSGALHAAAKQAPSAFRTQDYRTLLQRDDVDAVLLALPSGFHADAAVAAFMAAKHVYLEKPLATTVQDAARVLQAWKQSQCAGMIGFNYRFNKLYRRARQLIAEGTLGDIIAVRSVFSTAGRAMPAWKTRRASGGGVLLDLGSHHFDLLRFLLNTEIGEISCALQSRVTEADTAFVGMKLANGATAQSFFSFCAVDEDRLDVYGTAGTIRVDRCHGMDVMRERPAGSERRTDSIRNMIRSLRGIGYGLARQRAAGHEPSWSLALEHFIAVVRGERVPAPDLNDGYESLKVALAAEVAAARELQPA